MLQSAISTLGLVISSASLLYLAYQAQQVYALYFRVARSPLQKYKLTTGTKGAGDKSVPWALITGSSGGLGFGFARYLLSLGFGVIILANEGIERAEAKLRKDFPNGHIKSLTYDCLSASISDIQGLVDRYKDLPITILINNVGGVPMEFPHFRRFEEFEYQGIENHWRMNASFMTHLTRLMLPVLKKNASPRSLVLSIASSGRIGMPYMTMYSATKAYVSALSHTLTRELRIFNEPVDSLLIFPGDVETDGNRVGVWSGAPKGNDYSKIVLDRVDGAVERGLLEITPYWKHALQLYTFTWVPESFIAPELFKIMDAKKRGWEEEHKKQG